MHCTNCGVSLPPDARFCAGCGKAVVQAEKPPTAPASAAQVPPEPPTPLPQSAYVKCPKCGTSIPRGATRCFKCGKENLDLSQTAPPPSVPAKKDAHRWAEAYRKPPISLRVGCLSVFGLCVLISIISALMTNNTQNTANTPPRDYTSGGWARKAVADETVASRMVGGFSYNERQLYYLGLRHIANQHEKIGSFTIGQVVGQEQEREQQLAAMAQATQPGGSNGATTEPTAEATERPQAAVNSCTFTDGKPVRGVVVDDVCYGAAKVEVTSTIGESEYLPGTRAGGRFVIIRLWVNNESHETRQISVSESKLTDSDGNTYTTSSDGETALSMSGDKSAEFLISQVQPHITKTISLVYDVSPGHSRFTLRIPHGLLSGGEDGILPIQL